jgi:hypothetical protein
MDVLVFSSGFAEALFQAGRPGAQFNAEPFAGYDFDDSDAEDDDDALLTPTDEHAETSEHPLADPSSPVAEAEEPDPDTEGPPITPKAVLSAPGSPRGAAPLPSLFGLAPPPAPGPPKMRVVVRDASYWTYRAMLHYVIPASITTPGSAD